MNATIARRTQTVHPAARVQGRELRIVPIQGPSTQNPAYRVLDAQALDFVQISEASQAGNVPELLVTNTADQALFLMDGQELLGAKQNRILNTDVLVAANTTLRIPVSCVEQSRWAYRSATFTPGKSASHRTRSAKQVRVHDSLKRDGRHDADQHAVWSEVEATLFSSGAASSPTRALADGYASRQNELNGFRQSLELPDDAVGVAVFHGSKLQGLDLFDRHVTLKHFWSSIVDSYAIDWLGTAADQPPVDAPSEKDIAAVQSALARAAQAQWEPFDAPGLGKDWRLQDAELVGSALVWEDEAVIHLQLFPTGQK